MKTKSKLISAACIAALAFCVPVSGWAKEKKSASPAPAASPAASAAASPAAKSPKALPFHGKISAVDQTAKTFSIAGKNTTRVYKITDKTVITKDEKPATMADVAENEEVRGSYWKQADGSLEAKTVKLGQKAESKPTTKKEKAASESMASPSPAASPKATP
jgi:hypothetical protein